MRVYGKNVLERILKDENLCKKVNSIYLEEGILKKYGDLRGKFSNSSIKILPKSNLDDLANGLHQGIIIDMEDYHYTSLKEFINKKKDNMTILMLDHILDPHNLGAIIRSAVALSFDAIIIPSDRQVLVNSTVVKTSVGALFDIDIILVNNLNNAIAELKKNSFWIYGAVVDGVNINNLDYKGNICLIVGNEGKGISKLVKKNCDFLVSIPISEKVDSLNASVAAGILMYEVVRNRK